MSHEFSQCLIVDGVIRADEDIVHEMEPSTKSSPMYLLTYINICGQRSYHYTLIFSRITTAADFPTDHWIEPGKEEGIALRALEHNNPAPPQKCVGFWVYA